jgi:hypothetical protein
MNPGAVLVGLAAAVVSVSYIARPFRKRDTLDQEIEAWVAALRPAEARTAIEPLQTKTEPPRTQTEPPRTQTEPPRTQTEPARTGAEEFVEGQVEPAGRAESDVAFCHQCGRPVRAHHRFCPRCGANLSEDDV